ncbi:hypothetical protein HMPREF3239_02545 [Staphylococcus sp. HMSC34C02]|uniref:hypothetical protein n=1 Tax=Staphylococcus sp. HMSC34C02 TaxID=1608858 RepID=UPI0008A86BB2|nr:hypothetical protein [Staphylococcus sp. HMSC34C02]OHR80697.1 hypothetical protein HMPREF3239_02545 [Staphylococcus sp. HMSC34C02]
MRKIKDNDALKEQIITLKAKLGIVSLNFLCAIAIFAMFDDKRIKYTDMNTPNLENRGAIPRGILNLIPNYRYADEQQKFVILNVHATNFNWIMIGLSIVSVIDVIIEFAMHRFPLVAIIALIYSVILLLIVKVKTKHLCKLHDE